MPEKELDSMATVQIKPDYAASEVYSTTSEPPPAYKRQSTSVQIARIVAFTVIVSSFIIGCFILASAYLQARASCDQMQALDSVLEKELMLEALQQTNKEIPHAEALIGNNNNNLNKESDELDLQNLDKDDSLSDKKIDDTKSNKLNTIPTQATKDENESDSSLSSSSDSDESDDMKQVKVPLELDLSELAAALLENNQKSRMNCVVERKHAEELVDSPAKTMQLPFGMNLTTDPKKAKITGERISIFCESGNENDNKRNEDAEPIRPMFIPFQRFPIPYGAQPQQIPLTHMPQNMPPQPQYQIHQIPPPFQQISMRPPMPPQFIQAPRREPQLRIQVQQIPVREIHIPQEIAQELQGNSNEMPQIQVQRVPLGVALERAGITADDLRNIQRMAEERITDELRRIAAEESISNSEASSDSSNEDDDDEQPESQPQSNEQPSTQSQQVQQQQQQSESSQSSQQEQQQQQQQESEQPSEPQQTLNPPMPEQPPQMLQLGRGAYGRSLSTPVRIPVPMMQSQEMSQESTESERPHFVHPRSVRSLDSALHREKRVKRFACNCAC